MAEVFYATGKRKTSIARVYLQADKTGLTVNGKPLNEYFGNDYFSSMATLALSKLQKTDSFGGKTFVKGGGVSGQAQAICNGLAKAMVLHSPEIKPELRKLGYITRDSRIVERKKVGLHKARKRPQYSKR